MTHGLLTVSKKRITMPLMIIDRYKTISRAVCIRFLNKNYICVKKFFIFVEIFQLFINSDGKTFSTAFTKIFPQVGKFLASHDGRNFPIIY